MTSNIYYQINNPFEECYFKTLIIPIQIYMIEIDQVLSSTGIWGYYFFGLKAFRFTNVTNDSIIAFKQHLYLNRLMQIYSVKFWVQRPFHAIHDFCRVMSSRLSSDIIIFLCL